MGSKRGWGPSWTASRLSVEGCWGGVEVLVVVVVWEVGVFVAVVVANLIVVDAWGVGVVVVWGLMDAFALGVDGGTCTSEAAR